MSCAYYLILPEVLNYYFLDCSFHRIQKILISASTPENHILTKWPELALQLGVNFTTISKLKRDLLMDTKSLFDVVYELLLTWRMRVGSAGATLINFIACINAVGFNNISSNT